MHDGPGIRTTVFLKGCSLCCPWCCNPENINPKPQYYYKKSRCIVNDGSCKYWDCPFSTSSDIEKVLRTISVDSAEKCKSGAIGRYGEWFTTEKLIDELLKDIDFWGEEGGVTFSGGEPFLQMNALEPVLVELKNRGINLCAETSLYAPTKAIEKIERYFDEIFVDIKLLDEKRCQSVLGGDLKLYLKNLEILANSSVSVCLRHPQISNITDDEETMKAIEKLLIKYPQMKYQVIDEHHFGDEKYQSLGKHSL